MENLVLFEEEKKAIADVTDIFLKQNFGRLPRSIKVLMDNSIVVIQVDNFLSQAEVEMGMEEGKIKLIHEIHSKLFHKVKSPFIDQINRITSKKVISSQINVSIETKAFTMLFFLA